jgi:hypothetical protein
MQRRIGVDVEAVEDAAGLAVEGVADPAQRLPPAS